MPNIRMFPPPPGATNPITFANGGTRYQVAVGTPVDMPPGDAEFLSTNGWFPAASGGGRGSPEMAQVGPTSARPVAKLGTSVPLDAGTHYVDTTLAKVIVWDAASGVWRDPASGSAV